MNADGSGRRNLTPEATPSAAPTTTPALVAGRPQIAFMSGGTDMATCTS